MRGAADTYPQANKRLLKPLIVTGPRSILDNGKRFSRRILGVQNSERIPEVPHAGPSRWRASRQAAPQNSLCGLVKSVGLREFAVTFSLSLRFNEWLA